MFETGLNLDYISITFKDRGEEGLFFGSRGKYIRMNKDNSLQAAISEVSYKLKWIWCSITL